MLKKLKYKHNYKKQKKQENKIIEAIAYKKYTKILESIEEQKIEHTKNQLENKHYGHTEGIYMSDVALTNIICLLYQTEELGEALNRIILEISTKTHIPNNTIINNIEMIIIGQQLANQDVLANSYKTSYTDIQKIKNKKSEA